MGDSLDEILDKLVQYIERGEANGRPVHFIGEYKQAILDWHNKQIEEVLDRLEVADAKLTDGRNLELDIPSWVEAERTRLRGDDE